MKKTIAITLTVLMLLMSVLAVIPTAAEEATIPEENILFSEEDFKDAADLTKYFKVIDPTDDTKKPTIKFNKETGRLRVEAVSNTVIEITGENDALRNMTGEYTVEADFYLVEKNTANKMTMMGLGINAVKWSTGYYTQFNLYHENNTAAIYISDYNADVVKQYGSPKMDITDWVDTQTGNFANKCSVKLVVSENYVQWYIEGIEGNDGVAYQTLKTLMSIKEGCPFLLFRDKNVYEIDNIRVYKNVEESNDTGDTGDTSDTDNTENTGNTVENTTDTSDITADTETDTKVADGSAEATETVAQSEEKSGCGSTIGLFAAFPVVAGVGIIASKRVKKKDTE